MRLLNVKTFRLEEFVDRRHPAYAILSHTWGKDSEEVSFRDVVNGMLETPEARPIKLSGCCKQAKDDGYEYVWIDTCCIDKTNSVELQEAINSMFRWYREAHICYAFLSDISTGDDPSDRRSRFFSSRWFQRGWTLQELLAPQNVRFYSSDWRHLGTKGDLCDVIEEITGVPTQFLLGIAELHHASMAQRMSWAARRTTKRKEDIAYCLLGIFGVTMPMIYGEGGKAFRRLQEQIMIDIRDDSILAWGLDLGESPPDTSSAFLSRGVLAASPSDFANCCQIVSRERPINNSFNMHGGSLWLQLFLGPTSTGGSFGLLTCGPEHDRDKVVGIPLVTAPRGPSGEYMRTAGRYASLMPKPVTQDSPKHVQIRIDGECKPSAAPSQPYWVRVQKSVSSIELIDVEPLSRWHRERALIEVVAEPDSGGMQRTLARFRHKIDESLDFLVMLEVEAQSSGLQARCHLMTASRQTSLQDVTRKFSDMRPEAFGRQSAGNGILNLHVTLEHVATQRIFVIRLGTLSSSPTVSVNATLELQYIGLMVAIECIQTAEEKKVREKEELSQKLEERTASLGQMKRELEVVKNELKKLREKENLLVNALEDGTQEIGQLNIRHEEIRQQQESMSTRRLETHGRLNELRNNKSTTGENSEQQMAEGTRILHWAAQNGHEAIAQMLLDRGADVTAKDQRDRTPLHLAAHDGQGAVVRILLDGGADVAAKAQGDVTPLHLAAQGGHGAVAQMLLDRGADVTAKCQGDWTPLHLAAENGHKAVAQILLDRGADIAAKGRGDWTPLHLAAYNVHEAVTQILLDRGADVAPKSQGDWTPLHLAAYNGHEAVTQILLDRVADVAAKAEGDVTPLHLAAENGHKAIVQILLNRGANIAAKDQKDWTPLHLAAQNGHQAIAQILLDRGADVAAKSRGDMTPLHLAAKNGHEDVAQMLADSGVVTTKKVGRPPNQPTRMTQPATVKGHGPHR